MVEAVVEGRKKPGIVIFVAILQFFSSSLFFFLSLGSGLAILFGAAWGLDQYVTQQVSTYAPNPNFSYGLAVFFGVMSVLFLAISTFFLVVGIGLLNGRKYAWYLQIFMSVLSTLGLLSLPVSMVSGVFILPVNSLLHLAILILFFRDRVRSYFGV
jgi:hypothetical protein